MPQPIPKGTRLNFDFRRTAILERRNLAPYIVAISMHWNEIESRLGIFLASLMGGEAKTIVRVFLALQTDGGRRATLDTVASMKLPEDQLKRFQEIQKTLSSRYSERNKAIHGAWGISPEYPNDLLWYDPREGVSAFPDLMEKIGDGRESERQAVLDELNTNIRIYKEQDFKDILARFENAYAELEAFTKPYIAPLFDKMNKLS